MVSGSVLAGCSAAPWDWDDCVEDAADVVWDGVKAAARGVGDAAGTFASWTTQGVIYIAGAPFVLAAQAIDGALAAVGIDTELGSAVYGAVRRLARKAGGFVGSVVSAVLSDPKTFLLVIGAALSCGATAAGVVVAAGACAATLEQATERIIAQTVAETVEQLVEPLLGEEVARIAGDLAAKYGGDVKAGKLPEMPSAADVEAQARQLAQRGVAAGARALRSAASLYREQVTAEAAAYLERLDLAELRDALPQPFAALSHLRDRLRATASALDYADQAAALAVRSAAGVASRAIARGTSPAAALAAMRSTIDRATLAGEAALREAARATVLDLPDVRDVTRDLNGLGVVADSPQLRAAIGAAIAEAVAAHPDLSVPTILDTLPVWSALDTAGRLRSRLTLPQLVDLRAVALYAAPALAAYRGAAPAARRAALLAAIDAAPRAPDSTTTPQRAALLAPYVADYFREATQMPLPFRTAADAPDLTMRRDALDPLRGQTFAERVAAAQAADAAQASKLPAWALPAAAVAVAAFLLMRRRK